MSSKRVTRPSAVAVLRGTSLTPLFGGLLAAIIAVQPAVAEDFYAGKTVTMVIGSKPGGGTDTTARLVARFWADHIPGKPQMVVRNKGVQITWANEMHHSVRPDGLTIGAFAGAGSIGPIRRKSGNVKYDPMQWGIIGSIDRGSDILFVRKSALDRLTDKSKPPVAVGSVTTDRPQDAMAVWGAEYLGWNIKFVLGYPSSNQVYLAYERGEVDMLGSATTTILNRFLKDGGAVPVASEHERPDFPKVKGFEQVLGANKPTGVAWRAFNSWSGTKVDKYFAMPPKVPDPLLKVLRQSFLDTCRDSRFVELANNTLGEGSTPINHVTTRENIEAAMSIPPEVAEFSRKLRTKYGLPQISKMK